MARTTAVRLTGEDLTVSDVWEVAVGNARAELDDSAREKMAAARAVVEDALGRDEPTYGVTTGFGRFVNTRVPGELAEELQVRLLNDDRRKDAEIRGAALQRLVWDPEIPGDYLDVKVKDGWVTLDGEVDHQYQRDRAFDHVASLYGVTGVTNDIKVVERL